VRDFDHSAMRRNALLSLVLATVAALLFPAAGSAAKTFTFFGSGFGHGLGMSQWGAYGMALDGSAYGGILRHFYSGTDVKKASDPPATLRIGLTQARQKIHVKSISGPTTLRVGNRHDGPLVGKIPSGDEWTVRVHGKKYRVFDAQGDRVGGRDWGGTANDLFATYVPDGARVHVPEGGATYNRGYLEFNLYDCGDGKCQMRLILPVDPQGYLYGLAEVPSSWPQSALRAQAVAARTYAFSKAATAQHRKPCNCALYDSSLDQVYSGWNKESGIDGDRWVDAVDDTDEKVVVYQGNLIQAFYASSSGGYTENNENVWGGAPIAWLRGVCDPGDYTGANPNRVWEETFSASELKSALIPYTGSIGLVKSFANYKRGVSGRIESVTVKGGQGSAVVTGTELRAALGLRDDRVWINKNKNVTGAIRTKYDNLMCAPGLPKSKEFQDVGGNHQRFVVGTIYHTNVAKLTVWLRGAINDEYTEVGGPDGVLDLPMSSPIAITGVQGCAGGACRRVTFKDGRIYRKDSVGAFALWGDVLDAYLGAGGAKGDLGFPTSRVIEPGDGSSSATFEHGSIDCPSNGGACSVS
jgi:SpoIID/LytB domain protein